MENRCGRWRMRKSLLPGRTFPSWLAYLLITEVSHDRVASVVLSFCNVLAGCDSRTGALSAGLAVPVTLSHCGDCRRGRAPADLGGNYVPRKIAGGAVSGVRPAGSTRSSTMLAPTCALAAPEAAC